MKYLVIWVVVNWVSTPCPDWKPNPYTGRYPNTMCLVNHGRYEDTPMKSLFETREDAEAFIESAPEEIKHTMNIVEVATNPKAEG